MILNCKYDSPVAEASSWVCVSNRAAALTNLFHSDKEKGGTAMTTDATSESL